MNYFYIIFTIFTIILWYLIIHSSLNHENLFLDKFTNKLGIISGFIATAALYSGYYLNKSNVSLAEKNVTFQIIDRGWININHKILEYYKLCPNFCDSLYFSWQKK
jgi:hypothetical protein